MATGFNRFRGISFPFRKGPSGFPAAGTDDQLILDALKQTIRTSPGERVMRPEVGCKAQDILFENNSQAVLAIAARTIAQAIRDCEPRALLVDLEITRQDSHVVVIVYYSVNGKVQEPLLVPLE